MTPRLIRALALVRLGLLAFVGSLLAVSFIVTCWVVSTVLHG